MKKKRRFALSANAHLIDDKTVAKMGHPVVVVGPDVPLVQKQQRTAKQVLRFAKDDNLKNNGNDWGGCGS